LSPEYPVYIYTMAILDLSKHQIHLGQKFPFRHWLLLRKLQLGKGFNRDEELYKSVKLYRERGNGLKRI